jgi:Protein of unknown function (DUF3618)
MTENNTVPTDESPEAIRRDIEQTRAQLVETAQQLSDKADVKAQAHQKLEQSGAKIKETISQAKGSAPAPVQQAVDKVGASLAPLSGTAAARARAYRKQILIGALVLGVLLSLRHLRAGARKGES